VIVRVAVTRPRKRFGQHFLSPEWTRKVVAAIRPAPGQAFLEIGPGRGAITLPLAASGARILAIEIDRDLAADLRPRLPANVQLIEADVLAADLPALLRQAGMAPPVRVAGNLPYNLSSPILFRLFELQRAHGLFEDATLMLQREVADRLAAAIGTKEYGVLTIMTRLSAGVERRLLLPPGAFRPAPRVWSAVVRLAFREPAVRIGDPAAFGRFVTGLFTQRRKTVANALRATGADPALIGGALASAGVEPRRRPETLDLPELSALADLLGFAGGRAVL
jgi:16S rRNA (adenine1518-N6/adenine1519-N6)-dimethyltransferase